MARGSSRGSRRHIRHNLNVWRASFARGALSRSAYKSWPPLGSDSPPRRERLEGASVHTRRWRLSGLALHLGPDFILAPAGLVSERGIRPGRAAEALLGGLVSPNACWLRDRREGLCSDAPLDVALPVAAGFGALGLLAERLLLYSFEDASFVVSIGICACFGCALLEVIREPIPSRAEREALEARQAEFLVFADQRLERGGRCHERDVIRAFRDFYPCYRRADISGTTNGVRSPSDIEVGRLVRSWNSRLGVPGERTTAGFYKGFSVAPQQRGVGEAP